MSCPEPNDHLNKVEEQLSIMPYHKNNAEAFLKVNSFGYFSIGMNADKNDEIISIGIFGKVIIINKDALK